MVLRASCLVLLGAVLSLAAVAEQRWDSIRGAIETAPPPGPHWFTLRNGHTGHVLDAATGESQGTLTLSLFSPALRPHVEAGMVYTYGSFYTRTYYGDRTDAVIFFDLETMSPVDEVIIPPKAAGIGHSGMIGLIDQRFIGVWNITPGMSVSIVDVESRTFTGEISTPGCATVYPQGRGFFMICGDGALQYVSLDETGTENGRLRSRTFFSVEDDPVFDYSVPTEHGWVFVSLEGMVFEARIEDDEIVIEEPWSILSETDRADGWRISGRQPFAYNAATGIFMTLMHQGGTQDNYKEPGTELWAFNLRTQRRGYRTELDNPSRNIALTRDDDPVVLVVGTEDRSVDVRQARSGRLLRTIEEVGGLVQVF
ncbi:MAG: methylamine utilization protein MauE [Gammaproteobacteria bacterium]|nr:MAG: methylamine utilization protein MauE [Gammaproteobacteria bacterium]